MNKNLVGVLIVLVALGLVVFGLNNPSSNSSSEATAPDGFSVPELSNLATQGQVDFDKSCASCHGTFGLGTENGPPLMHKIYEPGHHGDGSFFNAAINGVRAHHWKFGDMPPVEGITETEIQSIVAYVRELQKANGIF